MNMLARICALLLGFLLSACGGGGGAGGTPALGGGTALFTSAPAAVTIDVGRAAEYVISGGRAPYTVSSSDLVSVSTGMQGNSAFIISGVKGGSATVTVKDAAGASVAIAVTVGSSSALFTTAPGQLTLALGAAETFNIGGGAGPFTVASANGSTVSAKLGNSGTAFTLTGQQSGSTTVLISDAKGATVSIAVSVGQGNVALYTSAANPVVIALGTTPVYAIGGGTGPYTATSSNDAVARPTVSGTALSIAGVASGTATVQVTDAIGGKVTIGLTVGNADVVALYTTSPANLVLTKSVPRSFVIGGGVGPYSASSSNNAVVSAAVTGASLALEGLGVGTASVSVFDSQGRSTSIAITVNAAAPLAVTAPEALIVAPGSSGAYQVSGGVPPYQATSSNSAVATVALTGTALTISAVLPGQAQINVRDSANALRVVSLTVAPAQSLFVSAPSGVSMSSGTSATYSVGGGTPGYSVSSSNTAVVTASLSGTTLTLNALSTGTATVVVRDAAGATQSVAVTAGPAVALFTTAPATLSMAQGTSLTYSILGGQSPYFASSGNPASVSTSVVGSILTISGTLPGNSALAVRDSLGAAVSVAVTVGNQTPLFTSAPANVVMSAGTQRSFTVDGGAPTVAGGAPSYQVVSSDPSVVTVAMVGNSLTLSAVSGGTAQVVITDSLGARVGFQVTVGGAIALHTTAPAAITVSPGAVNAQTYEIRGGASPYTVTSGNVGVATASVSGTIFTVTGVGVGSANLQVTDRLGATVPLAVTVASGAAAPLSVAPLAATGTVGDTIRFEVRGGTPVYTATVANQNVASAAAFGAAAAFTVQLTALGSSNIAVIDSLGQIQNVSVTAQNNVLTPLFTSAPALATLALGVPQTFAVGGGSGSYLFASSDVSVVTVPAASSTQLVLTPAGIGTATVSVTDSAGARATFNVVVGGVQPLRLSAGASVTLGLTAGATTYGIIGGRTPYTAVSTNAAVVSVAPPGATTNLILTPVASGTANVVVTDAAGTQTTLGVTVAQSGVQTMSVSPATASANVGDQLVFAVSGGTSPYTFTVNNNSIATLTSASPGPSPGRLRMDNAGSTTIAVSDSAGQVQLVTLTVTQSATQLRLSPTTLLLPETYQLGVDAAASNLLLNIYGGAGGFTAYTTDPVRTSVSIVNGSQIRVARGTSGTLCSNTDVTRYAIANTAVTDPTQPAATNAFDVVITVVDSKGASATTKLVIIDDGLNTDPLGDCR